ncbi:Frigida-like [Parasponia andersonii]|uniref:FRIGIDA-like protein n=1 Tax=Parasponia andersonii TaxID=3476 RepID=A0A2P5B3D7_PARAD|nr:Frigida-like [Parasponia andersonii]
MAQKVCKEGQYSLIALKDATFKEISDLKSVMRVIEERKLESEYPLELLVKRIEQLEMQKASRKGMHRPVARCKAYAATISASKPPGQRKAGAAEWKEVSSTRRPIRSYISTEDFQGSKVNCSLIPTTAFASWSCSICELISCTLCSVRRCSISCPICGFISWDIWLGRGTNRTTSYGGYGLPPQYHPSYYPQ